MKSKTNVKSKKYIEQNYLNGNNYNLKNNNNNDNYIPVEERLFYSSDELEKEKITNKKSNKTIVEENGKIKINLKELKQEIKDKEKSNTLNPSKQRKIKKIEIINIPENINKNFQSPFIKPNQNISQNESDNTNLTNHQIKENLLQNELNIEKDKNTENLISSNIENELKEKIIKSDIYDKNNNINNENIMIEENMNNDNLINDENIDDKKNTFNGNINNENIMVDINVVPKEYGLKNVKIHIAKLVISMIKTQIHV